MRATYTLSKVARAIGVVVPYLTLVRFNALSECFAASAVGVLLLRRYGFDAKAVPVDAIVAKRASNGGDLMTGIIGSPTSVLERLVRCHQIKFREDTAPPSSLPIGAHAVIQCRGWIIDPTLGQLNGVHPNLIKNPGVAAETKLDGQSCELDPETSVSWHTSAKAKEYARLCSQALRHYDPLGAGKKNSGYYADCKDAVSALLSVNLDMGKWYDMWPHDFAADLCRKLLAAGFDYESSGPSGPTPRS